MTEIVEIEKKDDEEVAVYFLRFPTFTQIFSVFF